MHQDVESIMFSKEQIAARIAELARHARSGLCGLRDRSWSGY